MKYLLNFGGAIDDSKHDGRGTDVVQTSVVTKYVSDGVWRH